MPVRWSATVISKSSTDQSRQNTKRPRDIFKALWKVLCHGSTTSVRLSPLYPDPTKFGRCVWKKNPPAQNPGMLLGHLGKLFCVPQMCPFLLVPLTLPQPPSFRNVSKTPGQYGSTAGKRKPNWVFQECPSQ